MSSEKHCLGPRAGDAVAVRYFDAVLFKNIPGSTRIKPAIREAIGWLEREEEDFVCLVWERFAEPFSGEESEIRISGLSIRRADIIEMKKIA